MTDYKLVQAELIDWLTQNEEKVLDGTFPKFHAILADPPYALPGGFMNKKWDQFSSPQAYQAWVTEWASLLLKFVYPGAVGMFFGGTRTVHRLTSGLEDAGWEIADCLMYLYGSGFPKNHSFRRVGEAWEGHGTALKPAYEPVVLARAPRDGTYAQCATKYGTSALNVDGARIPANGEETARVNSGAKGNGYLYGASVTYDSETHPAGRWPANVILDDVAAAALDAQSGERPAGGAVTGNEPSYTGKTGIYGTMGRQKWEPYQDGGGPSRFFYTSKASTWERTAGMDERSNHPTVKPADLTRYLATLLLPPELDESRRILVPFAGIGSEMLGAILAGWDSVVGIEQSEDYITQAHKRLAWWSQFDSIEAAKKAYQQEQKRAKEVVEWFTS